MRAKNTWSLFFPLFIITIQWIKHYGIALKISFSAKFYDIKLPSYWIMYFVEQLCFWDSFLVYLAKHGKHAMSIMWNHFYFYWMFKRRSIISYICNNSNARQGNSALFSSINTHTFYHVFTASWCKCITTNHDILKDSLSRS